MNEKQQTPIEEFAAKTVVLSELMTELIEQQNDTIKNELKAIKERLDIAESKIRWISVQ